jgi:dienelactone hydrolase
MNEPQRWPREAWIPLLVGLYWLWSAPAHGILGFLFSVLPGGLLLGSGLAMLLMPGDLRISQFAALGGVLGVIFALPAFAVVGIGHGFLLVAGSVASFAAAGLHTLQLEPHPEEVPLPDGTLGLGVQVAIDEALLATMTLSLPLPRGEDHARIAGEIEAARELFQSNGWFEEPSAYHVEPPPVEKPSLTSRTTRSVVYEHLRFESEYEPRVEEPGSDRWLSYVPNRTAHAWVLRHRGAPRPWLVCIHGYQMGRPGVDLLAFRPEWLHHGHGMNLLLPVLPLHGPRTIGRRSGDGFLAGEVLDTVHAETQAMWDIRRMLGWLRAEGAPAVGVMGLSLGGYNAALLAELDDELACAIPGIPAADFTRLFFRHGPPLQVRQAELHGSGEDHMDEVLQVVSPLRLPVRVPKERLAIFGGVADRLVPAEQVRDLWRHWDRPRIEWYQGAHLTFPRHRAVRSLVDATLRESGLAA